MIGKCYSNKSIEEQSCPKRPSNSISIPFTTRIHKIEMMMEPSRTTTWPPSKFMKQTNLSNSGSNSKWIKKTKLLGMKPRTMIKMLITMKTKRNTKSGTKSKKSTQTIQNWRMSLLGWISILIRPKWIRIEHKSIAMAWCNEQNYHKKQGSQDKVSRQMNLISPTS